MKRLCSILISLLALSLALSRPAASADFEELEVVNRPVNTSGLTGLIATTTPFTLPSGFLEIGVSTMSETSTVPKFTITEYPLSIAYGAARNMEIAVKGSYLYREEGSNPARKRGAGDTELLSKWNFLPQREGSSLPSLAAILAVFGLTGDPDNGLNRVHNWGARIGLSAGREIVWGDHVAGIYADAQLAVRDLNEVQYRDRYSIVNAGVLLPISKQHNLQIILEYSTVNGKRFDDIDGGDSSTITYGLRLVNERFNLTVGSQYIHKKLQGYDTSSRVVGTLSIKLL